MRPRTRNLVDRAYRWTTVPPIPEDVVEIKPGVAVPRFVLTDQQRSKGESLTFFDRLPVQLEVRGRSVLDVGCGSGELCAELARRGAARVLGVDVAHDRINLAKALLRAEDPGLPVELRTYGGDLRELGGERFDVVLSKDSFEHYGAIEGTPSAERMVEDMGLRSLTDGGLLTIGFGPLWKAPFGGHIDVRLPWAHLIFPQEVVFDEFRRVRPPGKTARTFEQGAGVNRMTLERFLRVMRGSGLDLVAMDTNVSRNRFVSPLRVLARYPPLREYCTQNVYGVWRLPAT